MINVIGLGYIGLPTSLMLASHGLEVCGTDWDDELVENLRVGRLTFKEKGLKEIYEKALNNGITFSKEYQSTNLYIISVPTPYDEESKKIDAEYIVSAVAQVLKVCLDNAIIVIESTISPGTIDQLVRPLIEQCCNKTNIKLAHAPERIIPGNMLYELIHNDRTIGAEDMETAERVKKIYASFCQGEIVMTDIRSAEMTKVVENTYRAVNIAFANELAKICRREGMNVYDIIRICNMHPRVNVLQPGPGVGGHCIAVDPWFLVGDYPDLTKLIYSGLTVNEDMPGFVLNRVYEIAKERNIDSTERIGLYGLTYKENVEDIRNSPTLQLLDIQKRSLADGLKVYDPYVEKDVVKHQYHDLDKFLDEIDLVIIMVKHNEIIDYSYKLEGKIVLDCHNVLKGDNIYYL